MAQGHIYIYGIISPYQDDMASQYGEVNIKDINNQLTNNKEADELLVHINSMGGDVFEGYAIHDILKASGKKITTQAEGLVASIATVIYLAGDTRLITENSELMVHNPWGFAGGDSTEVQKYADNLKKEEDKLATFYATKTGGNIEDIKAMMAEETYLTATEAVEKGFATEITTQIKAVAMLNIKPNNSKMEKKEVQELINASLESPTFWDKVKAMFKPKAMVKQDGTGKELEFPDLQEGDEIKVGDKVNVDGKPANGDFVMPDGVTLKVENGAVTEIVPKEEPAPPAPAETEDMKALKAELKAKDEEMKAIKADMKALKEMIETDPGIKAVRESVSPSGMKVGYKPKK